LDGLGSTSELFDSVRMSKFSMKKNTLRRGRTTEHFTERNRPKSIGFQSVFEANLSLKATSGLVLATGPNLRQQWFLFDLFAAVSHGCDQGVQTQHLCWTGNPLRINGRRRSSMVQCPGRFTSVVVCATTETYQKHPENPQDWTNINIGVQ
jgi:hypothetical protein